MDYKVLVTVLVPEIEKNYDKVILITEDDLNIKLTNNMIAVRV